MMDPFRQFATPAVAYDAQLIGQSAALEPYRVHDLQFVGRDPMRCTVDTQTRRLTCDGKASGCVSTPNGVICPPGTSLSDDAIPTGWIGLLGLGIIIWAFMR